MYVLAFLYAYSMRMCVCVYVCMPCMCMCMRAYMCMCMLILHRFKLISYIIHYTVLVYYSNTDSNVQYNSVIIILHMTLQ